MRILAAIILALLVSSTATARADDTDAEELARQQDRVEKHLLRVQQERFEAQARGDNVKSVRRLDREFKRTYGRRNDIIEERRELEEQ